MTRRQSLLLVEDDGAIREAMVELFESMGYGVTAVATAEQGLEALEGRGYSALVTDYALPGECGGWLIHEARRRGLLRQMRVILVTALLHPPRLNDVTVLRKPLDLTALINALSRVERHTFGAASGGGASA